MRGISYGIYQAVIVSSWNKYFTVMEEGASKHINDWYISNIAHSGSFMVFISTCTYLKVNMNEVHELQQSKQKHAFCSLCDFKVYRHISWWWRMQ